MVAVNGFPAVCLSIVVCLLLAIVHLSFSKKEKGVLCSVLVVAAVGPFAALCALFCCLALLHEIEDLVQCFSKELGRRVLMVLGSLEMSTFDRVGELKGCTG
jgi:hypothetical protein